MKIYELIVFLSLYSLLLDTFRDFRERFVPVHFLFSASVLRAADSRQVAARNLAWGGGEAIN